MIRTKTEFDFLLHEVLRDVTELRKTKGNHPEYVDDFVTSTIDEIRLKLNLIEE